MVIQLGSKQVFMKFLFISIFIFYLCPFLNGQVAEENFKKNEFSGGMLLNKRPFLGASIMYKRLGNYNFRIRFDGEKANEKYNHRDDYLFFRIGADKTWVIRSWRLGLGLDVFGSWIEELNDSTKVNNYQSGLMPFVNLHYMITDNVSFGIEGGPKVSYYLRRSESKSGWSFQGLQGVALLISYRL